MSSQRASAREAIATVGHALAGQSQLVMFVGGTVTALYPLEGGMALRPTLDVDCVVDLATTAEYYVFVERLRALGFRECTDENAPLCRLVYEDIHVDIVATSATGIGPTNRWYRDAFAEAAVHSLESNIEVRAITPLYFVATKLEAFRGRALGTTRRVMTSKTSSPFSRGSHPCASRSLPRPPPSRRSCAPSSSDSQRKRPSLTPSPPTSRATSSGKPAPTSCSPGSPRCVASDLTALPFGFTGPGRRTKRLHRPRASDGTPRSIPPLQAWAKAAVGRRS